MAIKIDMEKTFASRGSSIGCELHLMKRRSQARIPHPPTLAWACQKKEKTFDCMELSFILAILSKLGFHST
jgi:hypothetical protein